MLTPSGGIARIPGAQPPANPEGDASDSWRSWGTTTTRGQVLVLTSDGNAHRIPVEVLPALVRSDLGQSLAGTVALADIVSGSLGRDVEAIAVVSDDASKVLALGTRKGIVKRVKPDWPSNRDTWPVVKLDEDDRVVGASNSQATDFGVFLTRSAQLLKFPIDTVRPQGAPAAGMAGIKLASNDEAIFFAAVEETPTAVVATVTEPRDGLPGTVPGSAKLTPLAEYPAKGRATMGVRCHRFLKDEGHLRLAWAGEFRPVATSAAGTPVALPSEFGKRDASGVAVTSVIEALG